MSSSARLPSHVMLFGESLKPLLRKVQDALHDGEHPVALGGNFVADGPELWDELADCVERVANEMNGALAEVVATADVPDAHVHRAIGRFELALDELLGSYARVCELDFDARHRHGHELMLVVYRHPVTQLRDWLQDAIETIADPMAAIRKRGLPTSGKVTLDLMLTFTAGPEHDAWMDWLRRQTEREERRADDLERDRSVDKWVAAAAGFALGGLFFGGDE